MSSSEDDPLVAMRPVFAREPKTLGQAPHMYSRALHEKICELVQAGNDPVVAAQSEGVPRRVFLQWMRKGLEGDPHLWEFARDVEKAASGAEIEAIAIVKKFSVDDPANARWWLEHSRPERYSIHVSRLVQEQLGEAFKRLEAAYPPEEFERMVAVMYGLPLPPTETPKLLIAVTTEKDEDVG